MTYADQGYEIVSGLVPADLGEKIVRLSIAFADRDFVPMAHRRWSTIGDALRLPQVVEKAAECVGGEPAGLNSEFFFGKPGTLGFNPHQDNGFIQAPLGHLVSCWIALTDVDEGNGCLYVFPTSHKAGLLPTACRDETNRVDPCVIPAYAKAISVPMKKGDAIFMHGELVHGSYDNTSDRTRASLTLAYIRKGSPFRPGRHNRVEIDVT